MPSPILSVTHRLHTISACSGTIPRPAAAASGHGKVRPGAAGTPAPFPPTTPATVRGVAACCRLIVLRMSPGLGYAPTELVTGVEMQGRILGCHCGRGVTPF